MSQSILNPEAGRDSYVSLALWSTLRRYAGIGATVSGHGGGYLHVVNPRNSEVAPMRVLGSAIIPVDFVPEDRVHPVTVRIVNFLPYVFTIYAHFLRKNRSVLDFEL